MSVLHRIRNAVLGKPRDPYDKTIFHRLSLIAFFAWVGLGADGLSSSCYGPEEAFLALKTHTHLSLFVGLATALTVLIISASYSQIVELFPHGGGGYIVASKLLSPRVGMLSGCALLVDYVLTITLSVASGADAIFSFLPASWYGYRLLLAVAGVIILTVLNMRGVKESVIPLVPIFLIFIAMHVFVILYSVGIHLLDINAVISETSADVARSRSELGLLGMIFLLLKSYSLGAGTYTGIEAVSNGLPILREPKVQTARKTMRYMAISLAFTVLGLMIAYLLFRVGPEEGRTLNAVLFDRITQDWGVSGDYFVLIILISEAALLFVAAQTGFLDGPRVLSSMALDRWFPTRFAMLSDRLVTKNGILLMGSAALLLMILAHGSVRFLVVLYSINVFITFTLSQLGMVRHWWLYRHRAANWLRKLSVNGIGLILTSFILISVVIAKFYEGGWITIIITGSLITLALIIKRHYQKTLILLKRLDALVEASEKSGLSFLGGEKRTHSVAEVDTRARTAVLLVNGYNGLGLHSLLNLFRLFGKDFKNYVFIHVGALDAGNFKGTAEIDNLKEHVNKEAEKYVNLMRQHGFYAESATSVGIDVVEEITEVAQKVVKKFPRSVFFGGQLIFQEESFWVRLLHNYTVFAVQRRFYYNGIPFMMLPIRV